MMASYSPGGHSLVNDRDYQSATSAVTLASLSGLAEFNSPELQKKLSGLKVGVGPYINELYEGIGGSASPDDLETLFQLTYLYFTQPRFDANSLEGFKQRQRNVLENITINPYYYFGNAISGIKYQNHPRRQGIPTMENLEEIDINAAEQFYRDRFADASDFTFLFVGSFEVEQMKKYIQTYLGNLPATNRKENYQDVKARFAPGVIDSVITRGAAPKSIIDVTFHGDFEYSPKNRYEFNSMLSILRILLREQLREELGGVYGVNVSGFNTQRPTENYRIGIRFTAEPKMVDTLLQTTYRVIQQLQSDGPSQKEIDKVKETQIQSRIKAEKENSYWMSQLRYRYQEEMPLSGAATEVFQERVESLSTEAVQKAARAYFNFEQYMQLVLMPEED